MHISKRHIFLILIVIFFIALLWLSISFSDQFYVVAQVLQSYSEKFPVLSVAIFIFLGALSVLLFSFSNVWLIPPAIEAWGSEIALLLLLGGWVLGNIISYFIGKYAGYPLVRKIIPEKKIEEYKELFLSGSSGITFIFLTRCILPSEIPGYILGILRYSFSRYLLVTVLSEAPYAIIAVYAADAVLQKNIVLLVFWGALWALIAFFVIHRIRAKFIKKGKISKD